MKKSISFLCCLLAAGMTVGSLPFVTAYANSAQSYWRGRDAFGAYVTEENCPVTVTGEKLTLRIPEFPQTFYYSEEDFEHYAANVTAEYTFHNPASYDVEMTLVFPFGKKPDYLYDFYDGDGNWTSADDTQKYAVTADGEEIGRTIRHTLDSWTGDPATDISRLSDSRRKSGNFSSETPVTIYYYRQIATAETSKSAFLAAEFEGLGNADRTKVMLEGMSSYSSEKERIGCWGYGQVFSLYVIGEPLSRMPEWKVYENAACKKLTDGYVEQVPEWKLPTEKTTLGELFLKDYDAESGVNETDWFNAVFDECLEDETGLALKCTPRELNVADRLMRWYEYKLSIPAGESVVNSVTAPLYPSIDLDYSSPVYSYTYLLSPASSWADFGDFELNVETPYYITEGSLEFVKTDAGYAFSQQGLPEGELSFSMSESENPVPKRTPFLTSFAYFIAYFWWTIPVIGIIVAALIVGVVLTVIFVRKRKKTRQP